MFDRVTPSMPKEIEPEYIADILHEEVDKFQAAKLVKWSKWAKERLEEQGKSLDEHKETINKQQLEFNAVVAQLSDNSQKLTEQELALKGIDKWMKLKRDTLSAYAIGITVQMPGTKLIGEIIEARISAAGVSYLVRYFNEQFLEVVLPHARVKPVRLEDEVDDLLIPPSTFTLEKI